MPCDCDEPGHDADQHANDPADQGRDSGFGCFGAPGLSEEALAADVSEIIAKIVEVIHLGDIDAE
jgi:hypothetical protein